MRNNFLQSFLPDIQAVLKQVLTWILYTILLHAKINDTFSIRKQKQVGSQNSVSRNFQKPVNTVEGTSSALLCVTRHLFVTQLRQYGTLHKPGFNERRKHNVCLRLDRFHGEITPSLLCFHC